MAIKGTDVNIFIHWCPCALYFIPLSFSTFFLMAIIPFLLCTSLCLNLCVQGQVLRVTTICRRYRVDYSRGSRTSQLSYHHM
jgi:hypothetical protein